MILLMRFDDESDDSGDEVPAEVPDWDAWKRAHRLREVASFSTRNARGSVTDFWRDAGGNHRYIAACETQECWRG